MNEILMLATGEAWELTPSLLMMIIGAASTAAGFISRMEFLAKQHKMEIKLLEKEVSYLKRKVHRLESGDRHSSGEFPHAPV